MCATLQSHNFTGLKEMCRKHIEILQRMRNAAIAGDGLRAVDIQVCRWFARWPNGPQTAMP
jgi:hypothetical protein